MIGEYLGNIQKVDEALRKFQTNFRFPGEAQKI
ncbi:hypothetical protein B4U80_03571 [Leptotrombidium deliense]|uniref:SEC7 domain-containing protein n=1 Tax=Leptotrombidium deliense TaxID=299467 RepID=A0A443RX01_9ACAR|nr:hypothetical protein B4U80_03571 [Leptotrombidium deliense]